jgi:toxin ParE1/3/4
MTEDFHPEARSEFLEAIEFYAERKEGLDQEFRDAVHEALASIAADPLRFQRVKGEIRVFRLKRFPFYIYYEFMPVIESIWIWGVVHHRRRPDYWHDRLSG